MVCYSALQGYPSICIRRSPVIHLDEERHFENEVACPRTQRSDAQPVQRGYRAIRLSTIHPISHWLKWISKHTSTPLVHFSFLSGGGGRLFEDGRLLTFPTNRVGSYSRLGAYRLFLPTGWAPIRGYRLINFSFLQVGRLFEAGGLSTFPTYRVGAYSRLGTYQLFLPTGWALIRGGRFFEVERLIE